MKRRTFLAGTVAGLAAPLAAPSLARAANAKELRFIPQSDVTILDPIWTTAYVTRNHAYLIFDTLYGVDGHFQPQPQMVAGHITENDGKLWKLTLRDELLWHDGGKVLARDCVASIKRWGARDAFGQTLIAYIDELSAPDDKTIQFRLKRPFPLLPAALGHPGSAMCAMMPERLAKTSPYTQITEMVGSGPFKWNAKERVVGARAVYDRNPAYQPRPNGTPTRTAGPKIVHFDRVLWHVIPDISTKAAALENKEVDWWEDPTNDILPLLQAQPFLRTRVIDPTGLMACLRFNELYPPFNNPEIRRALLRGIDQTSVVQAVAGDNPKEYHVPTGIFTPGTPSASDAGLNVFRGKRDYAAVKKAIAAAGYKGEKIIYLDPTDFPVLRAEAAVCIDELRKCGFNVDDVAMDWGTVVQRRNKSDPPAQGGWNAFSTFWSGLDQSNPVGHAFLRGNGKKALFGWPTSPKIEELRQQWIDAPDAAARKKLSVELQLQALHDVPYVPLGQVFPSTAYLKDIHGILDGFVKFWNVRRV